ncbi:PH domain-containing protein [Sulfurisoma sediminicola]|uniref:PH (Pleckstrin Homology) domain-containing protein n=1 Tax=Sulfurisoma sediminicola TaxID=1381557 RepID=A0A497XDY8_9PROT|nr:PH domain-containing protein [Sulfurisoma sediminicola]RLJ65173.1 hypothetical protein DFR35_1829 [Sulfurisoma sediminicola]
MSAQAMARKVPAHAARLLAPGESVRHLVRPRAVPLRMLLTLGTIFVALAAFSAVVEPGFIRLGVLPALPLVGGYAAHMVHSPAILVTDRRIVSAARWQRPLSVDLERLAAFKVQQGALERRLGYGTVFLLVQPPEDLGEGVFLSFELARIPDAESLGTAVSAALADLRVVRDGDRA